MHYNIFGDEVLLKDFIATAIEEITNNKLIPSQYLICGETYCSKCALSSSCDTNQEFSDLSNFPEIKEQFPEYFI